MTLISITLTSAITAKAPTLGSRSMASRRSRAKPPKSASALSIKPSRCKPRVRTASAITISAPDSSGGNNGRAYTAVSDSGNSSETGVKSNSMPNSAAPNSKPTSGNQPRAAAIAEGSLRGATGRMVRKAIAERKPPIKVAPARLNRLHPRGRDHRGRIRPPRRMSPYRIALPPPPL